MREKKIWVLCSKIEKVTCYFQQILTIKSEVCYRRSHTIFVFCDQNHGVAVYNR